MAIYKKINGKDQKLAENSIIDHNQLSNRDAYGSHPISAIRNLPEKLTQNKKAIEEESTRATNRENYIEEHAQQIDLVDNNNGTISFINYDGEESDPIRTGHLVDNETIHEIGVDNTTLEVIGITGTFTEDGQEHTELYDAEDIYNDIKAAKSISLDKGQNGTLIFTDYEGQQITVQGGYLPDGETIELQNIDNQDKLVAVALKTGKGNLSGQTILDVLNNKGGYLNSYNFNTLTPTQSQLTQYALQDIGIEDPLEIWSGTRVINLYTTNNHKVPDTWSWDLNSQSWSNLGNISPVTDANNDGLHGLVTGDAETDYKVAINADGTMSVNSLPELADQVEENETKLNNLVINQRSEADDKTYSADYVNEHFAPLSFVNRLYLEKSGVNEAQLINTPPTIDVNNYINAVAASDYISWATPAMTIYRTLQADTTLSNESSFTITLNFKSDRSCSLSFGAKIKISEDNGTTWTYIGDEQSYGQEDYTLDALSSTQFITYTNMLSIPTLYETDSILAIEVYLKLSTGDTTQTTLRVSCGTEEDNSNVYSFVQFNYQNVMIGTDQIADKSITYQKLDDNLRGKIDKIGDASLNTAAQTLSGAINELLSDKQDKNDNNLNTTSKNVVEAINELESTKQNNITGAASTITTNNLTANKVLVSDTNGKIAVGDLDTTQLASLLVANTITWHEEDEEQQEELEEPQEE